MKTYLFFISLSCISLITRAQDCSSYYVYNALDKTTFATSCGENNEHGWVVRKNSCNFYTPLTSNTDDVAGKWIDIKAVFTGTDNLDSRDFVWIFYYVNGNTVKTNTIKGELDRKSYDFRDSLFIPASGSYRFRIAMVCDEGDENWELENGKLSICTRTVSGEIIEEPAPPVQSVVSITADRGTAKLKWIAEPAEYGNYFKIERSGNGEKYEFAGFVKENKSTGQTTSYSFIDAGALNPQTWYRIKHVDDSGKETAFGEVISIKF